MLSCMVWGCEGEGIQGGSVLLQSFLELVLRVTFRVLIITVGSRQLALRIKLKIRANSFTWRNTHTQTSLLKKNHKSV